jgi:hypothetical protein
MAEYFWDFLRHIEIDNLQGFASSPSWSARRSAPTINYLAAELMRYYKKKIFLSQQSCGELAP